MPRQGTDTLGQAGSRPLALRDWLAEFGLPVEAAQTRPDCGLSVFCVPAKKVGVTFARLRAVHRVTSRLRSEQRGEGLGRGTGAISCQERSGYAPSSPTAPHTAWLRSIQRTAT